MAAQKSLAFEVTEYRRRVAAVQAEMHAQGLDLVLATTMASVCYLSGIESVSPHKFWLVAVPASGEPLLLCEDFESHNALLDSWLAPEHTYGLGADPIEATARLIGAMGVTRGRIGTEQSNYSSMSIAAFLRLRGAVEKNGAELVDATSCVPVVMSIKSEPEIAYLREAGRITGDAMRAAVDAVRTGATDNDVAAAAGGALTRGGSEYASYPVIVTTGARSGVPHTTYKRVPIERGDPVFMEIAGCIRRYQTPMMRTAVLGGPTAKERDMASAAICSVNTMLENIRPGAVAHEVAAKSARCIDVLKFPLVWHGYYGYSVGLGFPPEWSDHPELLIKKDNPRVLRAGMVFHCSTSLRDIGVCGATCSETVLVTQTGCEALTIGTRELYRC